MLHPVNGSSETRENLICTYTMNMLVLHHKRTTSICHFDFVKIICKLPWTLSHCEKLRLHKLRNAKRCCRTKCHFISLSFIAAKPSDGSVIQAGICRIEITFHLSNHGQVHPRPDVPAPNASVLLLGLLFETVIKTGAYFRLTKKSVCKLKLE